MRLINVETYESVEFVGKNVPAYAILSHRWGDQEVSLRDLETGDWLRRKDKEEGRNKITGCCAVAAAEDLDFVWIDTCCIDKTSSAELSEAINSMFRWYREATICFAYLSDVDSSENLFAPGSGFAQSTWFTRGWTLQELLAPFEVIFLGYDWAEIGSKSTLQSMITFITGISREALVDRTFSKFSVAQKMSWAANRQTTRIEDMTYFLLGLFDVNMPLLYGEGDRAFLRLQGKIMKRTDDESIFAWTQSHSQRIHDYMDRTGLLAPSPTFFRQCSKITMVERWRQNPLKNAESTEDYPSAFELIGQRIRVRRQVLGPLASNASDRFGHGHRIT